MKISKVSYLLLLMNLLFFPLTGNVGLFELIKLNFVVDVIGYLLPTAYFISFVFDYYNEFLIHKKIYYTKITIACLIFIITLLISFFSSIVFEFSNFTALISFVFLAGYILTLDIYKIDDNKLKKLFYIMIALSTMISLLGIFQYFLKIGGTSAGIEKYPGALYRINSTMYIATILDKFMIFNVILLYYIIFIKDFFVKNNKLMYVLIVSTILSVTALAFTFSRTGIIIFYCISALFFLLNLCKKQYKNMLFVLLIVIYVYAIPGQNHLLSSSAYQVNNIGEKIFEKTNMDFLIKPFNGVLNLFIIDGFSDIVSHGEENEQNDVEDSENDKDSSENDKDSSENDKDSSENELYENVINDNSVMDREYFKNVGIKVIESDMFTGIGPGSYTHIYNNQNVNEYIKEPLDVTSMYMYPHNFYIHFIAELGILGFISFAIILFVIFINNVNKKNTMFIMFMFFALLLSCYTESVFYMKDLYIWFLILCMMSSKINMKDIFK